MNYPNNTAVQNYNVSAGRLVQLPCFMDQPEPPDGFRAIVFATPEIGLNGEFQNQTGPIFDGNSSGAIQFDLTQLLQQNSLSRARSIMVQSTAVIGPATTGLGGEPITLDLLFDSGLFVPVTPQPAASESVVVCDFISANPIFALWASQTFISTIGNAYFTIAVANFDLRFSASSSGSSTNPV